MPVPYAEVDIDRTRGDTHKFTFTLTNSSGAININGYTFELTVDPSPTPINADNNLFTLTGSVVGDGSAGQVEFELTALQADQTPKEYYYDVEWTDGGGLTRTIIKGKWTVYQDITK